MNIKFQLLWSQSSVSTFSAQTIPLDLSGYNFVLVFFTDSAAGWANDGASVLIKVNSGFKYKCLTQGGGKVRYRQVSATSSGVTFESGVNIETYSQETANNNYTIPVSIYGIRL